MTWSVLDHERRPKRGHAALAAACRSVLPMLDPRTGHVHVANELRRPFPGAEIEVRIGEAHAGSSAATWPPTPWPTSARVDIPAGATAVDVALRQPDLGEITNRYGPTLLSAARPPTVPEPPA